MVSDNPIEQVFGEQPAANGLDDALFGDGLPLGEDDGLEGLLDRPAELLSFESADEVAALGPEQRIDRLFENMYSYKRELLAVVAECKSACPFGRISALIAGIQKSAQSVYAAESILHMLVNAGALEMVTAEGAPYVQTEVEPIVVERDGKTFLEIAKPPEVFWRATPAGLRALEGNDSMQAVEGLFSEQPVFLPAYAVLLQLCARDGGADVKTLKEAVNERPEMVERKKTAQFLLENLSQAGALVYDADCKAWRTNDVGSAALRLLEER